MCRFRHGSQPIGPHCNDGWDNGGMRSKTPYDGRARTVIALTVLVCLIVPVIGFQLCRSTLIPAAETRILIGLSKWPELFHDCSAVFAFMFSTGGCVALLAILGIIDFRFVRSARTVLGDIIVSASPIVYVTGIKWLVERPRPITAAQSNLLPSDPSFPSGHTAGAVIVATMIILTVRNAAYRKMEDTRCQSRGGGAASAGSSARNSVGSTDRNTADHVERNIIADYTKRAVPVCVILVVAVAASRLLLGVHFPTDVCTSAIVCPLISYTVWVIREHLHMTREQHGCV